MYRHILLLLVLSYQVYGAEPFSRHFSYAAICLYDSSSEDYLGGCEESSRARNSFYMNYDGSTDILWVSASGDRTRLRNLGLLSRDKNDGGEDVEVFSFLDGEGDQIYIAWSGDWLRIVYRGVLMIVFQDTPVVSGTVSSGMEM